MKTLVDRFKFVMEQTGHNPTSWATTAGLSRDHVRQTIINERDSIDIVTVAKLASVTPYSAEWLAFGRGSPLRQGTDVSDDPKYPARAVAIVAARVIGCRETAITAALAVDDLASDPGPGYWLDLIRLKDLEHRQTEPADSKSR